MLHPNLEFVDEYQIDSEIQLRGTRGDLLKQRRWQFSIHPESHTERELRNTQRANVSERPRKREKNSLQFYSHTRTAQFDKAACVSVSGARLLP